LSWAPTRDELAKHAQCYSILKDAVAKAYRRLALLTVVREVKPLLLYISYDSHKHSRVLRQIAKSLSAKAKVDLEACRKHAGEAWRRVFESALAMASRKEKVMVEELLSIINDMERIESFADEEHLTSISSRILQLAPYGGNKELELCRAALELIAEDEERHISILRKIKEILINEEARWGVLTNSNAMTSKTVHVLSTFILKTLPTRHTNSTRGRVPWKS